RGIAEHDSEISQIARPIVGYDFFPGLRGQVAQVHLVELAGDLSQEYQHDVFELVGPARKLRHFDAKDIQLFEKVRIEKPAARPVVQAVAGGHDQPHVEQHACSVGLRVRYGSGFQKIQ